MRRKESKNVKETEAKSTILMEKVDTILLKVQYQIPHEHSPERPGHGSSGLAHLALSCYLVLGFYHNYLY